MTACTAAAAAAAAAAAGGGGGDDDVKGSSPFSTLFQLFLCPTQIFR
jgi:hypothetical protein